MFCDVLGQESLVELRTEIPRLGQDLLGQGLGSRLKGFGDNGGKKTNIGQRIHTIHHASHDGRKSL